jgi:hypothetical protein
MIALCPLYFLRSFYDSTSQAETVLSALAAKRMSSLENASAVTALVWDLRFEVFS